MTVNYGASIVTNGLTMMLDAANPLSYPGSGTVFSDLSGNGNTGTLTNSPTYSANNNGYFTFNGSSQYVNIGSSTSLGSLTTALTISSWITISSFPSAGGLSTIYDTGQSGSSKEQTFFRLDQSIASVAVGTYDGSTNFQTSYAYSNLSLNTWYNLVAGYTGTAWVLYVNGALVSSTTTTGPVSAGSVITVGVANNSGTLQRYWKGNISSVSVYSRSLSAAEIVQNFNAYRGRYGI